MRRTLFCLFLSLAVCLACASGALAGDYFNAAYPWRRPQAALWW